MKAEEKNNRISHANPAIASTPQPKPQLKINSRSYKSTPKNWKKS
jgi:hypothetical protein